MASFFPFVLSSYFSLFFPPFSLCGCCFMPRAPRHIKVSLTIVLALPAVSLFALTCYTQIGGSIENRINARWTTPCSTRHVMYVQEGAECGFLIELLADCCYPALADVHWFGANLTLAFIFYSSIVKVRLGTNCIYSFHLHDQCLNGCHFLKS